jgi:parallel beta-helix repeat protein
MTKKGILLALLLFFAATSPVSAMLTYSGEQSLWEDTVWQDEVLIDGVLTVAPGVTLEIRPGTIVRFTYRDSNGDGIGENEILSQGTLKALGTVERPILFTSALEKPQPGAWGAVNMLMSEVGNTLQYTTLEYGYRGFHAHYARADIKDSVFRFNLRGLQFQESTVTLARCRITDNLNGLQFRDSVVSLRDSVISGSYWGLRGVYNDLTLSGSRIENNRINGVNLRDSSLQAMGNQIVGNRRGLYLQRSQVALKENRLTGNSEHGLYLEESSGSVQANRISGNGRAGIRVVDFSGEISGNAIDDNGEYALQNDGKAPLQASGNWWGTADVDLIETLTRDARDRPESGPVSFSRPLPKAPAWLREE